MTALLKHAILLQARRGNVLPLRKTHARQTLRRIMDEELKKIETAGTWKSERMIKSKQGELITIEGQEKELLNFCANNYLGLSSSSAVIQAAQDALKNYGAGLSSVRFICGTQDLHKELERKISQFHDREDTILYPSCFDANAGFFEALLTNEDAVVSDELNHASIIDGIRLCKAKKLLYRHRDMKDLDNKLKEVCGARMKLIVTDGVFSMDGNIAPLVQICELADKHDALVFVDEAHATGVVGKTGRGTEELLHIEGKIDFINSTLGKALGGASGGYTTGPAEVVQLLRQRARPYLFSNALPPSVVGAGLKALGILDQSTSYFQRLKMNTKQFREAMTRAGFTVAGDEHPICPVMLGDAKLAHAFEKEMLEKGVYVIAFSYPVVPRGKSRIRVQLSASHTPAQIQKAITAFIETGKKLKVI